MEAGSSLWRGITSMPFVRGLHDVLSRRQFEAALHRERARADRAAGEFSLVLFRVRSGEFRTSCRLAKVVLSRARITDEVGWYDDECVGALLTDTGADGARAFAENVLGLAQQKLIPSICRFYTYPSAWYFDGDDRHRNNGNGRHSGNGKSNGNGNGNGHSNGGGNGNGNGHHAEAHSNGNRNGHSNGNGNGNGHANSNGNGNGHPVEDAGGAMKRLAFDGAVAVPAAVAVTPTVEPDTRLQLTPATPAAASELMPFVVQGMADELRMPAAEDGVASLLVRRLPKWKRAIDMGGAALGLIVLSPVMGVAALAIKISGPGPVMFKQRRAGLGGNPFWIYKFRTMTTDAEKRKAELRSVSEQDGPAFKLRHDPRVTRVGRFLRETSLDELPQLWNVIKGDMSLVGPRPLPMDESAACDQWQRRRLDVTPGLTCIWQVKGRSRVSFAEWMRMDVNYIRRRTLFHDVKILAQTIPAVLLRRGAR